MKIQDQLSLMVLQLSAHNEIFINDKFGSFPSVIEWHPPCCNCIVFHYNNSKEYFDYHYKCEKHKHLDGQELIDQLENDYLVSKPESWDYSKVKSITIGGGIKAPTIHKKIKLQKLTRIKTTVLFRKPINILSKIKKKWVTYFKK